MSLVTLAATASYEQVIKKSRFVARARRVETVQEAERFLAEVRDPDATHNCWAFRIGQTYRFSDDGEPGGTAGRPILGAIDSQGLDQVMVVVTRYYGGIKLGAGGLARAYGGTAASCLREASRKEIVAQVQGRLFAPFEHLGSVYHLLESYDVTKSAENYVQAGVEWVVQLPQDRAEEFQREITDATRGQATVRWNQD